MSKEFEEKVAIEILGGFEVKITDERIQIIIDNMENPAELKKIVANMIKEDESA